MKARIKQFVEEYFEEIVSIRRHLHTHPELSFKEHKTAQFVQNKLAEYSIPFTSGHVETGIIGIIEGKNPAKKVIALRADLDALPISEKNKVSYASLNEGVMHACGHDVHTSCLLGAENFETTSRGF